VCGGKEVVQVDLTFGRSEDVDVLEVVEWEEGSKMSKEMVDGKVEFPQVSWGSPVCVDIMCMSRRGIVQSSRLG
jgi:hypothetical protein